MKPFRDLRFVFAAGLVALTLVVLPAPAARGQEALSTGDTATDPGTDPGGEVHPFYRQLLDRGIYEAQQGDAEAAAQMLRLAVFGLLEEPPTLVRGLAHLALAQQAAGDGDDAAETLGRLLRMEERFGVYARAGLEPATEERLRELMMARLPEATLAASATFRPLADEMLRRRLAELPEKQRRAALAEAVARRPDDAGLQIALAELELDAGNRGEAARLADRVLALEGESARHAEAHCLRGVALADSACAAALPSLERCPRAARDVDTAAALLGCQAELGRWTEGAAFLAGVEPAVREARPVARLARRVEKQAQQLAREQAQQQARGARDEPTREAPAPADSAAPDAMGDDERQRLADARRQLAGATTAADLEQPLALARQVADAHPGASDAQHLVAEIAYRASAWQESARYFRRGGEPSRPELRFYMAVALFESGDAGAAREVLERALPELPKNPFVDSYTARIRGASAE